MACYDALAAKVFTGRDNIIRLVLIADGDVLADLSGVTRVVVDMDGGTTVIDSDIAGGGVIWWTDQQSYRGQTVDVLSLQLGDQSIPVGAYSDVELIVYDSTYPNGLRVENAVKITVQ